MRAKIGRYDMPAWLGVPLVTGMIAGLIAIGAAVAQVPGLFIASPTGLEQIEVVVPSVGAVTTNPQKQQITVNQIRNSEGYVLVGAGTTVNTTVPGRTIQFAVRYRF